MATKNFNITVTATDSDLNTTSETVQVKAGTPSAVNPTVTFVFPSRIAVRQGDSINPYWSPSTFLAPAPCQVTPTPTADAGGTGRFLVQTYYNSGLYPDSPSRRFAQTFDGYGTTLSASLVGESSPETSQMLVVSGGGVVGSGFAQQTDLASLRRSILLTNDSQKVRVGYRTDIFDELLIPYHHDLATNTVYTLKRGQFGTNPLSWTAGTPIEFHPYHYCPFYSNNGVSDFTVLPTILVMEEGTQFTLRGTVILSGTQVTGSNTTFLSQISGGVADKAIKFSSNANWYLISGIISDTSLVIYSHGDNNYLTSQIAQINGFTKGSGLVTVGTFLVGCENWDVRITPEYLNGDKVPSLSVTYTAETIQINPGGAISGTAKYLWQEISGSTITTLGSGQTQIVQYYDAVPKRIRVQVSGTGQPLCVHSDDTGYIALSPSINVGTWQASAEYGTSSSAGTTSAVTFMPITSVDAAAWFHHHLYEFESKRTTSTSTLSTTATEILVPKGSIDDWPNSGSVVVTAELTVPRKQMFFTFSSKITGQVNTADKLTGLVFVEGISLDVDAPFYSARQSMPSNSMVSMHYSHHFPWSQIVSVVNSTKIKVLDARALANPRPGSVKPVFISYKTAPYYQRNTIASVNLTTNEVTLTSPLPSQVAAGDTISVGPWRDSTGIIDSNMSSDNWNLHRLFTTQISAQGSTAQYAITTGSSLSIQLFEFGWESYTGSNLNIRTAKRGRMVIPRYGQTPRAIVIEYSSMTKGTNGVWTLNDCKLRSDLSGGLTFAMISAGELCLPFKEVKSKAVSIVTQPGSAPTITINSQGNTTFYYGIGSTHVDVIQGSNSQTVTIGTVATPVPNLPRWEHLFTGFPTNGLVQHDPIYKRDYPEPGTSGPFEPEYVPWPT